MKNLPKKMNRGGVSSVSKFGDFLGVVHFGGKQEVQTLSGQSTQEVRRGSFSGEPPFGCKPREKKTPTMLRPLKFCG